MASTLPNPRDGYVRRALGDRRDSLICDKALRFIRKKKPKRENKYKPAGLVFVVALFGLFHRVPELRLDDHKKARERERGGGRFFSLPGFTYKLDLYPSLGYNEGKSPLQQPDRRKRKMYFKHTWSSPFIMRWERKCRAIPPTVFFFSTIHLLTPSEHTAHQKNGPSIEKGRLYTLLVASGRLFFCCCCLVGAL